MGDWRIQERYRAMMSLPLEGLKIGWWMNGGAAIATLTHAGNVEIKNIKHLRTNLSTQLCGTALACLREQSRLGLPTLSKLTSFTALETPPRFRVPLFRPSGGRRSAGDLRRCVFSWCLSGCRCVLAANSPA